MLGILLIMSRQTSHSLTPRQKEILNFLYAFSSSNGFPPTIREIGQKFSIAPPSVLDHLKALERKDFIRRRPFKPRCLELLKKIWED